MTKRVNLDIPDKNFEELVSLSKFYNQNIEKTITDILEVIGFENRQLEKLTKEYKLLAKSRMVLSHFIGAASHSMDFFDAVLEKLEARGLFVLEDFEYDLDECNLTFTYVALQGSGLCFESFCLTLAPGVKSLRVESIIDVEKVNQQSLDKLKQLAMDFQEPTEFMDLEAVDIDVEDDLPEFAHLVISCNAEFVDNFPNVKVLSKTISKLYKTAGIEQENC